MSKTLLQGVNEVLKRSNIIQGDSGTLTSLTDSPRQVWIDTAVQVWNEAMEELYSVAGKPMPQELAEATITLVASDRDYALNAYNTLYWPFIDETNGQYIHKWEGGYLDLINSQPIPADYTGLPTYGVISPVNGQVYFDRLPTATEAGLVYKYRYDKDVSVSAAADTFPFTDAVFRAMVPAVNEMFSLAHKREFAEGLYNMSMGRAARMLSGKMARSHYGPQYTSGDGGVMAPFDG